MFPANAKYLPNLATDKQNTSKFSFTVQIFSTKQNIAAAYLLSTATFPALK
jgi:hypothetical protein